MKLFGLLLLLSGWFLTLADLVMLQANGLRLAFLAAGLAVEVLGLALLTWGYTAAQRRSR